MQIMIMRHGQAHSLAQSDAQRALTEQGKKDSVRAIQSVSHALTFDLVLVSPYLRAQQTWQSIEPYLTAKQVETFEDITPYGNAQDVVDYLQARIEVDNIQQLLLISHLPLVRDLTYELSNEAPAGFSTSNISHIEWSSSSQQGELLAHYLPE